MYRKKKTLLIFIIKITAVLLGAELEIYSSKYSARISRDSWGVPHIMAKQMQMFHLV